jgi:nitrate reductase NapE component
VPVTKKQANKLIGQQVYALKKDGSVASGKLLSIQGTRVILEQKKGKHVRTKAILPLALFDLLAIGTSPFVGGFGYSPYGYGYGYGYPGFFW